MTRTAYEVMREICQIDAILSDPAKSKGKKSTLKASQRKLYTEYTRLAKSEGLA